MPKTSSNQSTNPNHRKNARAFRIYLRRLLSGVIMLLLVPMLFMYGFEHLFYVRLDTTDKSLILFMLFFFFFAYLFILGFDTPVRMLEDWRRDLENRPSSASERGNGPSRSDDRPL